MRRSDRARATLPIDGEKFLGLFQFIAKGLIWHHWKTYLTDEHFVRVETLTKAGEAFFDERFFSLKARERVKVNLGNGTVVYEGLQGVGCPQITTWRVWMYGGILLAGDPVIAATASSRIDMVTGPKAVKRNVELAAKFGWKQPGWQLVR